MGPDFRYPLLDPAPDSWSTRAPGASVGGGGGIISKSLVIRFIHADHHIPEEHL